MNAALSARIPRPRWTAIAVWLLLAVVVAGAFTLRATGDMPAMVGDFATPAETSPTRAERVTDVIDKTPFAEQPAGLESAQRVRAMYEGRTLQLLPAWRWMGDTAFYTNAGGGFFESIGQSFAAALSFLFFSLASFVWSALLGIASWAFSPANDPVIQMQATLNRSARAMAASFVDTGLAYLIGAFIVIRALLSAVGGKIVKALRTIAVGLIPLALLVLIGGTYQPGPSQGGANPRQADLQNDRTEQEPTAWDNEVAAADVGTPAWFAAKGDSLLANFEGGIARGLSAITNGKNLNGASGAVAADPSCASYNNVLLWAYSQSEDMDSTLMTLSVLWERGYLRNWVQGQYGSVNGGMRSVCHLLEHNNGVPRLEQRRIGTAAGYPAYPADESAFLKIQEDLAQSLSKFSDAIDEDSDLDSGTVKVGAFTVNISDEMNKHDLDPFGSHMTGKKFEAQMFAWIACSWDGSGWKVQEAWRVAGQMEPAHCEKWWAGKDFDRLEWGPSLGSSTERLGPEPRGIGEDSFRDVRKTVEGFRGKSGGDRLLAGVMSLITAGFYAWALGMVVVGVAISRFGFLLLLALLPVTLLLLALPGKGSRSNAGKKLLKMTVAFGASKFAFSLLVILIIQTIVLFESLVTSDGGGLLTMIVPLAALLLVRKIVKAAGLGDLTTLDGSLAFAGAAAMQAAGQDTSGYRGAIGRNRLVGNLERRRAAKSDRMKGRVTSKVDSMLTAPKRALGAGRDVFGAGEDGKLPQLRRALFGRNTDGKDPNAKQEFGALQRWTSLAYMVDRYANRNGAPTGRGAAIANNVRRLSNSYNADKHQARVAGEQARLARAASNAARNGSSEERATAEMNEADARLRQLSASMPGGISLFDTDTPLMADLSDPQDRKQVLEAWREKADALGVKDEDLLVTAMLLPDVPRPKTGNADGSQRILEARTFEQTAELARHPIHYIPDEFKRRVASLPTQEAQHAALAGYLQAVGMIDPKDGKPFDILAMHGIDPSSDFGKQQIQAHLDGKDSELNNIQLTALSGTRQTAILQAATAAASLSNRDRVAVLSEQSELVDAGVEETRQVRSQAVRSVQTGSAIEALTDEFRRDMKDERDPTVLADRSLAHIDAIQASIQQAHGTLDAKAIGESFAQAMTSNLMTGLLSDLHRNDVEGKSNADKVEEVEKLESTVASAKDQFESQYAQLMAKLDELRAGMAAQKTEIEHARAAAEAVQTAGRDAVQSAVASVAAAFAEGDGSGAERRAAAAAEVALSRRDFDDPALADQVRQLTLHAISDAVSAAKQSPDLRDRDAVAGVALSAAQARIEDAVSELRQRASVPVDHTAVTAAAHAVARYEQQQWGAAEAQANDVLARCNRNQEEANRLLTAAQTTIDAAQAGPGQMPRARDMVSQG